jgi:hypothetical protein
MPSLLETIHKHRIQAHVSIGCLGRRGQADHRRCNGRGTQRRNDCREQLISHVVSPLVMFSRILFEFFILRHCLHFFEARPRVDNLNKDCGLW